MKTITIYSKNACAQCNMVKKQLTAKGIEFNEINLDEQPEYIQKVKDLGFSAAPVVVYGDFMFSGFNPTKVRELIAMVVE